MNEARPEEHRLVLLEDGVETRVELVSGSGGIWTVTIDGEQHQATLAAVSGGLFSLLLDGAVHDVHLRWEGERCRVDLGRTDLTRELTVYDRDRMPPAARRVATTASATEITAPMPGKIVTILAPPGTRVEAGQGVLVMEAMKMENELGAPSAGIVAEIRVAAGSTVETGMVLVVIGPAGGEEARSAADA